MIKCTYLLIDLLSLLVPLVFSFHPKIQFYKHWNALLPAIIITAVVYLLWDSLFVYLGVWGFDRSYVIGIYLGNLPIEEVLFFICIPYSCVFTFDCLTRVISAEYLQNKIQYINYGLALLLLVLSVIWHSKPYTVSAFLLLMVLLLIANYFKVSWMPKFYLIYGVLLIPFLVVNGLLTGTGLASPVVWYSPKGIIGLRLLTIPFEDIFYGMGLILSNVWLYSRIRSREWSSARVLS